VVVLQNVGKAMLGQQSASVVQAPALCEQAVQVDAVHTDPPQQSESCPHLFPTAVQVLHT
jgi:hypothetical protein